MALTIEVYYSFQSPYSYLAIEEIFGLEEKYDVSLLWQVFSAKASGEQVQAYPVVPEKLMYLIEDCKRYATDNNIPIVFPETWPESEFDPTRVSRGAVIAADMGILKEYLFKVYHHWWGEGQDPNEQDFMSELCDDLDIDVGDFLSKMSSSDTRERVKGLYKRGKKLSVFDTPTFVIDGERFVGIDKIHQIEMRLEKLGLRNSS
ncbi:MAG: DsbA family protein [Deltaproteobacteria bacterium]|nr:DsbA family protein [Deltaproteobacteria bacterium]